MMWAPNTAQAFTTSTKHSTAAAQAAIAQAQTEHAEPIVTELQAASVFYPAESEHDDYFRLHPYQGYCQMVIAPKVLHARDEFAHHWRQD
jgi:peptide-methionine (S)-S-oxide reductase